MTDVTEVHLGIVKNKKHMQVDGCIVLNEHNTVFASMRSATCNRCFPGPPESSTQTAFQSLQLFFAGLTRWQPNWQTDRPRYSSVTIGGIYTPVLWWVIFLMSIFIINSLIHRLNSYLRPCFVRSFTVSFVSSCTYFCLSLWRYNR